MTDYKFSNQGFKYPEGIFGAKYQKQPPSKPALLMHCYNPMKFDSEKPKNQIK